MRIAPALALLVTTTPAVAWEFTPVPVCTVTHETPEVSLRMTYDPRQSQAYSIALTRPEPWPEAPAFGIAYEGALPLSIGTGRHVLSDGGRTLTVSDSGFGNVLDGFEFNATATLGAEGLSIALDLSGASGPIAAFRDCTVAPTA